MRHQTHAMLLSALDTLGALLILPHEWHSADEGRGRSSQEKVHPAQLQ